MSCQAVSEGVVKGAARKSGVSATAGKSGFTAGSTNQVGFFALQQKISARMKQKPSPEKKARKTTVVKSQKTALKSNRPLPAQGKINLSDQFTEEELQRLSVQVRLGEAATARHIRELTGGVPRGLGHRDPRPLDWAYLDQTQYRFLAGQLHGDGKLDLTGLKPNQVVELWRFARFEADRAHRNIDHLAAPGNPTRPVGSQAADSPTADYLTAGHKLEARFYTLLAGEIEARVPVSRLHAGEVD